tara:strand:+ start:3871 stop:4152 length:282 start_codon:yes stop_codon:yes gene_type:complete
MKNRKFLLAAIVILSIGLTSFVSIQDSKVESTYNLATYCDGWEAGYIQGWCYEVPNCIKPIVPVCPIAKVGQDRYIDGYNRGFLKGKSNRRQP